jgi:competence protein ComEC
MPLLGPVGPVLLGLLCSIADVADFLAILCSRIPFACLAVSLELVFCLIVGLCLATLLYLSWPQPSRRTTSRALAVAFATLVLAIATTFLPALAQVVVLDVGQGDAILVRSGLAAVLIDTGPSDSALLNALARQRITHLDAVVITHLDVDHCGALEALNGTVSVGRVFFAEGLPAAQASDATFSTAAFLVGEGKIGELGLGDSLNLGDAMKLVMVWPRAPAVKGGNEESICFALEYDADRDSRPEARMLLTGDAEAPQLAGILSAAGETGFDALKVGHHGSRDAVTPRQLEEMGCRFAMISVGADNRYGHPTPETLAVLDDAGVRIYRTDLNGDIRILFSAERLSVRCATITEELSSQ